MLFLSHMLPGIVTLYFLPKNPPQRLAIQNKIGSYIQLSLSSLWVSIFKALTLRIFNSFVFLFLCVSSKWKVTKRQNWPWLLWFSGLGAGLQSKASLVQFPVRAHAWAACLVPSWGCEKQPLMFLLLSSPLFRNK